MIPLSLFLENEMNATPLAVIGIGNPMPPTDGCDGSEPMEFNKRAVKDRKKHKANRKKMEKEGVGTAGI